MKLKINLNNIATLCTLFFMVLIIVVILSLQPIDLHNYLKKNNNNRMHVIEFSTNIKIVMRIHIIHMVFV